MTKKRFFRVLEKVVLKKPELQAEAEGLKSLVQQMDSVNLNDKVNQKKIKKYLIAHPILRDAFREQLQEDAEKARKQQESDQSSDQSQDVQPKDKIFPVHKPLSDAIRQRIRLAEHDPNYRNWANSVKSVPEATLPIPVFDFHYIERATQIWNENICGNEDVLDRLLAHGIEYSRTGRTTAILLVGEPGIGKSLVAQNYGKILNLPYTIVNASTASNGRGLSGAPNVYVGASAGIIAQAMIDHKAGNPVLCFEEIDKPDGFFHGPDIQNDLLSLLDDSSVRFYDNYLEFELDASHIPFVFTANERDQIPPPLLDRMEVIKMAGPDLEMLHVITRERIVPKLMTNDVGQVELGDPEVDLLVDLLWNNGCSSVRAYQKAASIMISEAAVRSVKLKGACVRISENDVNVTVNRCLQDRRTKHIGFSG